MADTPELRERFRNYETRDAAMLDIARLYIDALGVGTDEMIQLFHDIPCLNDRKLADINEIFLRVRVANEQLPQARYIFSLCANFYEVPEKIEEQTDPGPAFVLCHNIVSQAEQLAETMNTPVRETIAVLARIGIQVAIHFILTSKRPEAKSQAKGNLIYFTLIEMLALGIKTNAYQYCFTNPEKATPEFFRHLDTIRPIIALRPGEDERKFKGSIVLGETAVEHLVVPKEGNEFYYIGGDGEPSSPNPQRGEE